MVLGAGGQLGTELVRLLPESSTIACTRCDLDICDADTVDAVLAKHRPSVVFNCAAYVDVERAEDEKDEAFEVNGHAVKTLALTCCRSDITLVHISTDYVFDGTARKPYKPDDLTNPKSIYGKSKLAGEQEVIRILKKHVIIRTAWMFSEYGGNFFNTILSLVKNRKNIDVTWLGNGKTSNKIVEILKIF